MRDGELQVIQPIIPAASHTEMFSQQSNLSERSRTGALTFLASPSGST